MSDTVKKLREKLVSMPVVDYVDQASETEMNFDEIKKEVKNVKNSFDESYLRDRFNLQI